MTVEYPIWEFREGDPLPNVGDTFVVELVEDDYLDENGEEVVLVTLRLSRPIAMHGFPPEKLLDVPEVNDDDDDSDYDDF
jgi:hypothetical protein